MSHRDTGFSNFDTPFSNQEFALKSVTLWMKWVAPMVCSVLMAVVASAQVYPTKAVTLVSPFAAGGTSDVIARATARLLEAELGQ